jgi:hypothetical protein
VISAFLVMKAAISLVVSSPVPRPDGGAAGPG